MHIGPQKRRTKVFHEVLNSISDYLRITTEDHLDFDELKLPTLDCQLWVKDYKMILNSMKSPKCLIGLCRVTVHYLNLVCMLV